MHIKIVKDGNKIGGMFREFPDMYPDTWTLSLNHVPGNRIAGLEYLKKYVLDKHPEAKFVVIYEEELKPIEPEVIEPKVIEPELIDSANDCTKEINDKLEEELLSTLRVMAGEEGYDEEDENRYIEIHYAILQKLHLLESAKELQRLPNQYHFQVTSAFIEAAITPLKAMPPDVYDLVVESTELMR